MTRHRFLLAALATGLARPAAAQTTDGQTAPANPGTTAAPTLPATAPSASSSTDAPNWIATLSSGALARDGDPAHPFAIVGLSRRIGRGYVQATATGFRSVLHEGDATLPSNFAIGSIGAGGKFGNWFVDGYASAGRQFYGTVVTPFGTRSNEVGADSGVYGASLNGGRFIALARRLYLTPSISLQYSQDKMLRSSSDPAGPFDYETVERAWTGSATMRLDRYFGGSNQNIAGFSLSRVQSSNGAAAVATTGTPLASTIVDVPDGWFVVGASGSLRVARRLWLDASGTRTVSARTGNYEVLSLGIRVGF